MVYEVGDIVKLKKPHPCGSYEWEILRVGADFRLKCMGCGWWRRTRGGFGSRISRKNTAKSRETACIFPAFLL